MTALKRESFNAWMKQNHNRYGIWYSDAVISHTSGKKARTSQLAREVGISLPNELPLAGNIKLTRRFVQETFVIKGTGNTEDRSTRY